MGDGAGIKKYQDLYISYSAEGTAMTELEELDIIQNGTKSMILKL